MDYEKKYNEALKIIEGLYNVVRYQSSSDALLISKTIEKAFPELCESENENIRKELYKYFRNLQLSSDREFSPSISIDEILSWLEKQGEQILANSAKTCKDEQNPAWSEDDEKFLNYAISLTDDAQIKNFLKSLKERVHPQPNQEWSEEDKKVLEAIIDVLINNTQSGSDGCVVYKAYIDWLKSLKDIVQPQSKQEWSEEDSEWYMVVKESILERWKNTDNKDLIELRDEAVNWLKSLKLNHWKPSGESMRNLAFAIENLTPNSMVRMQLESLYNDLKKL